MLIFLFNRKYQIMLTLLAVGFFWSVPDFHWSLLCDYRFGTVFIMVPTSVEIMVEAPAMPAPMPFVRLDPLDLPIRSLIGIPEPEEFKV